MYLTVTITSLRVIQNIKYNLIMYKSLYSYYIKINFLILILNFTIIQLCITNKSIDIVIEVHYDSR